VAVNILRVNLNPYIPLSYGFDRKVDFVKFVFTINKLGIVDTVQ
jgi:hypothetical protein